MKMGEVTRVGGIFLVGCFAEFGPLEEINEYKKLFITE